MVLDLLLEELVDVDDVDDSVELELDVEVDFEEVDDEEEEEEEEEEEDDDEVSTFNETPSFLQTVVNEASAVSASPSGHLEFKHETKEEPLFVHSHSISLKPLQSELDFEMSAAHAKRHAGGVATASFAKKATDNKAPRVVEKRIKDELLTSVEPDSMASFEKLESLDIITFCPVFIFFQNLCFRFDVLLKIEGPMFHFCT